MKFSTTLATTFAFLVASVSAQRIAVEAPEAGASVKAGEDLFVSLYRSIYIQNVDEIGLALGIQHCSQWCGEPSSLGKILYIGSFDPKGSPKQLQNFTLTIPEDAPSGEAHLTYQRYALVGASEVSLQDFGNVTINIA